MKHFVAGLVGVVASGGAAVAQVQELYINDGGVIRVFQGGVEVRSFGIDGSITPFVVDELKGVLWGRPENGSGLAREYDLFGNPTGETRPVNGASNQRDAAFDGITAWSMNNASPTSTVRSYDYDFTNEQVAFTFSNAPESFGIGLAYDGVNGTLWASNDVPGNTIRQLDLAGNTISTFVIPNQYAQGRPGPLAYESATNSLWFLNESGSILSNWAKDGTFIQSHSIAIGGHRYSMEFGFVIPGPGAAAALGLGLAAFRRRR